MDVLIGSFIDRIYNPKEKIFAVGDDWMLKTMGVNLENANETTNQTEETGF